MPGSNIIIIAEYIVVLKLGSNAFLVQIYHKVLQFNCFISYLLANIRNYYQVYLTSFFDYAIPSYKSFYYNQIKSKPVRNMKQPQTNQGRLYGWGKGYTNVKQISKDVKIMASGENHLIFVTFNQEVFGYGSNKFGQLGLPDLTSENQLKKLNFTIGTTKLVIQNIFCGAQHTFILTDKNQVYSMGLNIKGQLGHGNFQNLNKPKLVVSLLPHGTKNPKSLNPALQKQTKPPIVQLLQKFDLQVKIEEQPIQNILLLNQEQSISQISCGALFTVALSNKGRVFACGYQGSSIPSGGSSNQDYMDKAKFKLINFQNRIVSINCGLSGAGALSREGFVYVWGRFGKTVFNIPKKLTTKMNQDTINRQQEQRYAEIKIGDQFVAVLNVKGQVLTFGQNIDNQLGGTAQNLTYRANFQKVLNIPLIKSIFVGRNHCFALSGSNQLYGWGSNRYNQIGLSQSYSMVMKPRNLQQTLPQNCKVCPSSYCTYILSPQKLSFNIQTSPQKQKQKEKVPVPKVQEMIKLSQYKKLLQDYQVLKSLNLTLLQKSQPPKKINQEIQTLSKFDIDGVTKYRQFNSNIQINWNQLQILERINQGGYGVIYKAKWRQILVVVKKFKIQNGDVSLRDFLSQCNAMEAVRHPNIVMFLGAVTKAKNYSLILQYCSRGSLWSFLQNQDNQISWEERKRLAIQIAQGVLYLHCCTPPILHRDLKSLNIFLDQHLRIKIGDFGWTKTLDQYMTNKIGTYQWMAPEVIGNKPYTEKADVFSYSIIMWEIAARQPPYRNITGSKVSEDVLNKQLRPQIPKKTPQPFARLMKRCWDSDPLNRPTFKQVIRELQLMKL